MVATQPIKKATWLQYLVDSLGLKQDITVVYCDSQSAIHLSKNQMYHERTKHIDVRYHFLRKIISQGAIIVKKIGNSDNPADMLTKPISISKFKHYLDIIGVCRMWVFVSLKVVAEVWAEVWSLMKFQAKVEIVDMGGLNQKGSP